jgi:hypothetical protein
MKRVAGDEHFFHVSLGHSNTCGIGPRIESGCKPLTRRLLAATSDVMHSARHAEGNDAGHTRGQEATKADKGRMA